MAVQPDNREGQVPDSPADMHLTDAEIALVREYRQKEAPEEKKGHGPAAKITAGVLSLVTAGVFTGWVVKGRGGDAAPVSGDRPVATAPGTAGDVLPIATGAATSSVEATAGAGEVTGTFLYGEQTTSLEQMKAMDWHEFAKLSPPNRAAYTVLSLSGGQGFMALVSQKGVNFYVKPADGFTSGDLIAGLWDMSNKDALAQASGVEAAKIGTGLNYYTWNPMTNQPYKGALQDANEFMTKADPKAVPGASLVAIGQGQWQTAEDESGQKVSLIDIVVENHDINGKGSGQATQEAIPLTIKLQDGRTVTVVMRGLGTSGAVSPSPKHPF